MTQNLTPKDIVNELDRFIVGQNDAKRAVAIALRNRWRRQQLPANMREEVLPKNILMIGSTGVGKTEIARRLAKLVQAPFIKVEATKFTEIGYVGRDVEQIIRDLLDNAIQMEKSIAKTKNKDKAQHHAEETLLDILVGKSASSETRNKFRHMLKQGELDDREVEISVNDNSSSSMPSFDIPGMPGAQMGMINIGDMLGKLGGTRTKTIKTHVKEGLSILIKDAAEQLIEQEQIVHDAIENVEQNGIVFLDEIDKICAQREHRAADVSREGVQRDLLPLIEGTNVSTKHGNVKTDHILFITSGAFHLSKPSDLLPELQGRLPIRVELKPLTADDFIRILTEPEYNLIRQACALLETENVTLEFQQESLQEMANQAAQINEQVENIGARRLHTILEKLLEEISFNASEHRNQTITITKEMVTEKLGSLIANQDLSKFIL